MRKLFSNKKITKKSVLEFLDKKGFYVVLMLCVAIVGVTAFFVTTYDITSPEGNLDAENIIPEEMDMNASKNEGESSSIQSSIGNASSLDSEKGMQKTATATPQPSAKKETPKPSASGQKKAVATTNASAQANKPAAVKDPKFAMPVYGEITMDFAQDKLVYSKTLEEWRTHSGLDIGSERGTQVKAVADGVVTEVKNDPRFGIIVMIDHKNGYKSVYANLASDNMVNPNQKVKQGEVIGSVGNTASFESSEPSHLHFEVLKENKPVDPKKYLPMDKK